MTIRTTISCPICGKPGADAELPLRKGYVPLCSLSCKAAWDARHPRRKSPVEQPLFDLFGGEGDP
jgi:hypothetical protein